MPDSPSSPASHPSFRFGTRWLIAGVVLASFLFGGFAWLHRTILAPRREARAVERLLESLVDRRPDGVTRGQWGSAVAWTLNLHSNSMLMFEASAPRIAIFKEELQDRLSDRVSMKTIYWIWSEYAKLTRHGADYQRFQVQMINEIDNVGPNDDPWGMDVP